jgi:hypothetical protein
VGIPSIGIRGKECVNKNQPSAERAVRADGAEIGAVRMWTGGPLRQMAATKVGAFIPFAITINGCSFAGRYVCDGCQEPCGGVSLSDVGKLSGKRHFKWLCDLCIRGKQRKTRTPEQKQAAIDRLAAARRDRAATVRLQEGKMSLCNAVTAVCGSKSTQEVYGIM